MASLAVSAASFAVAVAPRTSLGCSAQPASYAPVTSFSFPTTLKLDRDDSLLSAMSVAPLSWAPMPSSASMPDAVLNPSAAFANIMWAAASKTFNTQILVGETESTESVVRRFKKVCLDANIVQECRRRRYFETTQDIVKRKQKDAARKRKRFQRSGGKPGGFFGPKEKAEPEKAQAAEEDDDVEWQGMS